MFWLWFLLVVAQCVLLYVLARAGDGLPRRAREEEDRNLAVPEDQWPAVAMIIPVAGSDPRMFPALKSLLAQDYPRLQHVLVTAEEEEPAAQVVRRLLADHPGARHVAAGQAEGCGQKNHNSLQGVAAVGDSAEVLVFCDSTHVAMPNFVRNLVAPIAGKEVSFTTGYHLVEPLDRSPATLGYTLCVLLMRLLQSVSAFTQLWGGAMAMTREGFRRCGVKELWERNVVDDCSLSAVLQARGEEVRLCTSALLSTEAAAHSRSAWRAWMDRQILFLKFCMPAQWVLLGVLAAMLVVPLVCGAAALLGGLLNLGGGSGLLLTLFWLAGAVPALHHLRGLLSTPVGLWSWFRAFLEAVVLFGRAYAGSVTARGISWHGVAYDVGRGGTVLRATRS